MHKEFKNINIIAGLIGIITFAVYIPALKNEFIRWDDFAYIQVNAFIRNLDMRLLKSAFCHFDISYWQPLTWISYAVDYAMWGLNPFGYHLTNNIIHSLNTIMVVFLAMRVMEVFKKTEKQGVSGQSSLSEETVMIAAAITGILFGVHPLHVESVAWVAERKDVMCAFFFLSALITYTYYASMRDSVSAGSVFLNSKYLLTVGLFALALMSKPMAVTLPVILLILDWCPFRKIQSLKMLRAAVIEKLPFFALSFILSLFAILAQADAISTLGNSPLSLRLLVAGKSLIVYLMKMVAPVNLIPLYPYPENVSLFSAEIFVPIVVVMVITAVCLNVMHTQKLWMSAWIYYVITLMPVLGIVQVSEQSMADRYTYLPSLGPFLVIGLIIAKGHEKVLALRQQKMGLRMISVFIAITMFISLSLATVKQIGVWRNNLVFWSYITEKEPGGNPFAHLNLGAEYRARGLFDKAIEQYQIALRLNPNYAEAHNNLGIVYKSQGLLDKAIEHYQIALRLNPNHANAHFNLGLIYLSKGFLDKARTEFELGLKINPNDYKARQTLDSITTKKN